MAENLKIFLVLVSALIFSCVLSAFFTRKLIKYFNKRKKGQFERNYLKNHLIKQGTPSMGGIAFVFSTLITFFFFSLFIKINNLIYPLLLGYLGFFLIGLVDDLSKMYRRSYHGLSGIMRILLEITVITYVVYLLKSYGFNLERLYFPLINNYLNLHFIFYAFIIFVILGSANAVNLTDGLDGLVSGLLMIGSVPFLMVSLKQGNYSLSLLLMSQVGSIIGFLFYNFHPAKIFMGDSGSLSLGALLSISAIILHSEIILLVAGFIFVLEALSVILQVSYFKLTRKRIFLMSPLHHHFEKKGWLEWKVVMVFYLFACLLSLLAVVMEAI